MTPLETLRKHVTGKIESGQATAIVEMPAKHVTNNQIVDAMKSEIRQTYKYRHQTNRRWNCTALDDVRENIKTLRRIESK